MGKISTITYFSRALLFRIAYKARSVHYLYMQSMQLYIMIYSWQREFANRFNFVFSNRA